MKFPVLLLAAVFSLPLAADDWPQWLGPKRDGVWRETGIVEKFPESGLKVRWRTPVRAGYSGPSVSQGRVYLTDRHVKPVPAAQGRRGAIPGTERVLCLDERDGKVLWQHEYDCTYGIAYAAGPRAHPVIDGDKVYTLGAEGNLFCFDAEKGNVIWSTDFNEAFGVATPLWGFSAHPLVDGHKLICLVGGTNSTAVAFDKNTGKVLWQALTAKEPGYAPPTLINASGRRELIIWHPESVNSLNPESGAVLWSHDWSIQNGLSIPTPRLWNKDHLFLTSFYNGSRMFKVDSANPDVVWASRKVSEKDTEALHSIMSTPFIEGDHIYGVCSQGELRCIKASDGERVWETLSATTTNDKKARWANAFLVKNGDRFFLPNEQGDLIIASLTPDGYKEISRTRLLDPTNKAAGRDVVWSHPAFANKSIYARNDRELICADLSANQ